MADLGLRMTLEYGRWRVRRRFLLRWQGIARAGHAHAVPSVEHLHHTSGVIDGTCTAGSVVDLLIDGLAVLGNGLAVKAEQSGDCAERSVFLGSIGHRQRCWSVGGFPPVCEGIEFVAVVLLGGSTSTQAGA